MVEAMVRRCAISRPNWFASAPVIALKQSRPRNSASYKRDEDEVMDEAGGAGCCNR